MLTGIDAHAGMLPGGTHGSSSSIVASRAGRCFNHRPTHSVGCAPRTCVNDPTAQSCPARQLAPALSRPATRARPAPGVRGRRRYSYVRDAQRSGSDGDRRRRNTRLPVESDNGRGREPAGARPETVEAGALWRDEGLGAVAVCCCCRGSSAAIVLGICANFAQAGRTRSQLVDALVAKLRAELMPGLRLLPATMPEAGHA